ncbi:histidine phosphatase family protein [Bauldia litoralis]|uniref:histidine phosphatase family protein n=1 Tax=Bauldia litoralis TaxID=665467 RepID=UPI003267B214
MKILAFILCLLPSLAFANDWDLLDEPDAVAIMRHAVAPGTGDPSAFALDDCSTQRNLDARGRAQARKIGDAFRERGIVFDQVLTSQWCRTRETAELLDVGPVMDAPSLNSFFRKTATRDRQTEETLKLIEGREGRLMLVSHQVNISALTGRGTRSGEILIIRMSGNAPEVVGSILIDP